MELSKRLQAVADMVTTGLSVADIGCDHGYVSIYLIQNKISPHVIAMDVNKGPLEIAKRHFVEYACLSQVETRLSDGAKKLNMIQNPDGECKPETEAMILAGMGGRLIIRILEDSKEKVAGMNEVIVQPQSEIEEVRKYLRKNKYQILSETMIFEEGKYYPVIKFSKKEDYTERIFEKNEKLYDCFGKLLLEEKNQVLFQFLEKEQQKYLEILTTIKANEIHSEKTRKRYSKLEEELALVREGLHYFEPLS